MKNLIFIIFSTYLFAGPPMLSNDPFVPDLYEFEINVAVEGEHKDAIVRRIPIVDINYGIIENVQLTLESAYVHSEEQSDFDSFEVAIKWLFYENDFFAIAFNPKYISYPVDSIFNEGEAYEITLPMNFTLNDSLDLVADITFVHPFEGEHHYEFGTYIKYKNDKHSYFVEIFMEEAEHQEDFFMLGGVGYMYQFHENVAFMISFGKEITNSEQRATVGYSGLQFVF